MAALREMRRALKPGGCHSGRPIPKLLKLGAWIMDDMAEGYISGPKPLAYKHRGSALAARVSFLAIISRYQPCSVMKLLNRVWVSEVSCGWTSSTWPTNLE